MVISKALLYSLVSIMACKTSASAQDQEKYREMIGIVFNKISKGNEISDEMILEVLPTSNSKAITFYEFDYDKSTSSYFRELNKIIAKRSMEGNPNILSAYILLSQFVDGYFAEVYFDNIATIATDKSELFCKLIGRLPPEKISRLKDIKESTCK